VLAATEQAPVQDSSRTESSVVLRAR
jgi:hypothetical protein